MPKLIIDTDTGSDDAIALLMALAHPDAEVLALTTVAGNVPLDQATRNAKSTLRVAERVDVPVYVGCDRPLVHSLETATEVHGEDGLGNANLPDPGISSQNEHAVPALVRLAAESNGEHDLITLGPLTNVAAALAIDPDLLTRFRRTVIMGGAPDMVGNVTDMAEFNIWVDPEAAARVFVAPGARVMVGWNVSMTAGLISPEQRQAMAQVGTASGQFAHDVTSVVEAFCHQELGIPFFSLPDPLAVAIALDDAIATRTQAIGVTVGRSDEARGATFPTHLNPDAPATDIVWEADGDAFQTQMFDALRVLP
jgi:purine nucleosidase